MIKKSGQINVRAIFLFLLIVALALFIGSNVVKLPPRIMIGLACGVIIGIITLVRTDIALGIIIFSMLLSPELTVAGVPGRAVVIRIEDFLLIGVIFTWLAKTAINKELGLLVRTPLNLPIIAYISVCLLFTLKGVIIGDVGYPRKSLFYLLKYSEYFLLYFLVANNIRSKREVKNFLFVFLIVCFIICFYGYFQMAQGITRITAPFEGPKGEPNTLGGYLLFMFPIASGLALYNPSRMGRLWSGALACFMIPPFLFTLSRGSFLAFPFMFLTLILLTREKRLILTIILVSFLILSPIILPHSVKGRITGTFKGREYEIGPIHTPLATSAGARVESWKYVFRAWKERPLLGYGITGFAFIDSQFVRTIAELGLIGLLVFIWLLVAIFRSGLRVYRKIEDRFSQGLTLGFLAGFIGLVILAMTANAFIIVRIMEPFWFIAAIVIMLPKIMAEEEHLPSEAKI